MHLFFRIIVYSKNKIENGGCTITQGCHFPGNKKKIFFLFNNIYYYLFIPGYMYEK